MQSELNQSCLCNLLTNAFLYLRQRIPNIMIITWRKIASSIHPSTTSPLVMFSITINYHPSIMHLCSLQGPWLWLLLFEQRNLVYRLVLAKSEQCQSVQWWYSGVMTLFLYLYFTQANISSTYLSSVCSSLMKWNKMSTISHNHYLTWLHLTRLDERVSLVDILFYNIVFLSFVTSLTLFYNNVRVYHKYEMRRLFHDELFVRGLAEYGIYSVCRFLVRTRQNT